MSAPQQQFLFEVEQTVRADGSFVVKPKRIVDGTEISAKRAAKMLGFKDRETIYGLIKTGQIRGWKPKSVKDNGKYRIDLGSVLDYKASRLAER
jgi:hypothetical protein